MLVLELDMTEVVYFVCNARFHFTNRLTLGNIQRAFNRIFAVYISGANNDIKLLMKHFMTRE